MELYCFVFASVVPKGVQDKESALSKEIHFGALFLLISGLGVLAIAVASIFINQRTSATESDYIVCEKPAILVVDVYANYSCEVPSDPTAPRVSVLPSPTGANSPSPSAIKTAATEVEPSAFIQPDKTLIYAQYTKAPKVGKKIGTLRLKELNKSMPLIEGSDRKSLKLGAGHYVNSVLPGAKDNSVIAGHRETVFKSLGKLKVGHHVIATTSAGTFTYIVTGTRIVDDEDRTVIVPTTDATLTLITCYPFEAYGPKPQRYIVSAKLISSKIKK